MGGGGGVEWEGSGDKVWREEERRWGGGKVDGKVLGEWWDIP